MDNQNSISVAMATYNGSRYLCEQLESLASQECLPCELVVCDDGSTDETVSILEDFSRRAASLCSGDFISFCDQDDVWLANKLKDAYEAISENSEVQLVLQNAYICNERLERSSRVFPDSIPPGLYGKESQFGFWVWLGFLQTFRASLLEGIAGVARPRNYYPFHKVLSHDKLTCLLANAFGGIFVLPRPAALYRRHSNALTGSYAAQTFRQRLDKAIRVGSDHYLFLAEVSAETAGYLRRLARNVHRDRGSYLIGSAESFDKLSRIYSLRADLYSSTIFMDRVENYVRVAQLGGYTGSPMISLGLKSAAKDLLCVFGLLGA